MTRCVHYPSLVLTCAFYATLLVRSALMKFSAKQVAMQITLIDDIFVQGIDVSATV